MKQYKLKNIGLFDSVIHFDQEWLEDEEISHCQHSNSLEELFSKKNYFVGITECIRSSIEKF